MTTTPVQELAIRKVHGVAGPPPQFAAGAAKAVTRAKKTSEAVLIVDSHHLTTDFDTETEHPITTAPPKTGANDSI